jgi:hygromycin-B 7''-O-kinase
MSFPLISSLEDFNRHFRDEIWEDVARAICDRHSISYDVVRRSEQGENIIFFVDEKYAIKIYAPSRRGFEREKAALGFAAGKMNLTIPEIVATGNIERSDYLVMTQLEWDPTGWQEWRKADKTEQAELLTGIATELKELHSLDPNIINFNWSGFLEHQIETCLERQRLAGANPEWLESLPRYLEENLFLLPKNPSDAFLHGDVHFGNLRVTKKGGKWRIFGMLDFADSLKGFHEYEFVAPGVLMIQGQGELQREFFRAYGYADKDIDETLRRRLMLLTILYECSDLRKYALRLDPGAVNLTLDELERAIWNFVKA